MVKELELEFEGKGEVKGFHFKQIKSNEYGYIYEVTYGSSRHYEVFKRKVVEMFTFDENNNRIPTGQKYSYPKSPAFGVWAWSCINREAAITRFDNLKNLKENE